LGQVFTDPISVTEAMQQGGMLYGIKKEPLYVCIGDEYREIVDRKALMRDLTQDDPEYRFFEIVSNDYDLTQNADLAAMFDPISNLWPTETVGALGHGETVFFTLDAGEMDVKGDLVKQYFLITDTRTGMKGLSIAFTGIRVVCQNTLIAGLKAASVSSSLKHNEGLRDNLNLRVELIAKMQASKAAMAAIFSRLGDTVITMEEAERVFEAAYPAPHKSALLILKDDGIELGEKWSKKIAAGMYQHDLAESNAVECRVAAKELYEKFNDETPSLANTPWASYQAVTELATWRSGRIEDAILRSVVFGTRAQESRRALDAAYKLCR
jgi:hypothetical protein